MEFFREQTRNPSNFRGLLFLTLDWLQVGDPSFASIWMDVPSSILVQGSRLHHHIPKQTGGWINVVTAEYPYTWVKMLKRQVSGYQNKRPMRTVSNSLGCRCRNPGMVKQPNSTWPCCEVSCTSSHWTPGVLGSIPPSCSTLKHVGEASRP